MPDGQIPLDLARGVNKSWRSVFQIHPACAAMRDLSDAEKSELSTSIAKHGLQHPPVFIEIDGQLQVLDGKNRLDALEKAGIAVVKADGKLAIAIETLDPTAKISPRDYVKATNLDRRHDTPQQRRRSLEKLLAEKPELSDRAIAKQAGVSPTTVAKARSPNVQSGHKPADKPRREASGQRARGRKPAAASSKPATPILVPPPPDASPTTAGQPPVAAVPSLASQEPSASIEQLRYCAKLREEARLALSETPFPEWPQLMNALIRELQMLKNDLPRQEALMREKGKCD